ncbi:Elongator complex protein 5 [Phycomyces nitens]|nr:Elongator complex protein 5 [Phycomyces nitens]
MSSLSLDQLLNNRKASPFTLINDTITMSALPLLVEFSTRALEAQQSLIVVLTETSPRQWLEWINPTSAIHIIDCYTDPLGWDQPIEPYTVKGATVVPIRLDDIERSILAPVLQQTKQSEACLVVVDSVNTLAMTSLHKTYQLIRGLESLTTDSIRLVVGYHRDIRLPSTHGPALGDSLDRLASSLVQLEPLKERTQFENQARLTGFMPADSFSYMSLMANWVSRGGLAHIEWRRKSGKILYETNGFCYNQRLEIVPALQLTGQVKVKEVVEVKADPMASLSFNLSLTDEQRKTKENLVLPYMKAQNEVQVDGQASGTIYYEPDAADDFDDEDPDDDLDI